VRFTLDEASVVQAARFSIPELFGQQPAYRRTQLLYGECVTILEEKAGWYRVRVPNQLVIDDQGIRGCHGWVWASSITLLSQATQKPSLQCTPSLILKKKVFVQEYPGLSAPALIEFSCGTMFFASEKAGWTRVTLLDGRQGFVAAEDCCDVGALTNLALGVRRAALVR
jgi:hypothetical protein